jgi:hypothetical protein
MRRFSMPAAGRSPRPACPCRRSRLRMAATCASWLLLFAAVHQNASARPALTNVDLLSAAADSAAVSFCRHAGLTRGDTLRLFLREDSSDARGSFILSRWILGLDRRDVRVVRSTDPSRAWSVFPSRADIRYAAGKGRGFLRSGSIRRTALVGLTWRRPSENGAVVPDTLAASCGDVIPRAALESVEQGGLLIGRPERPGPGLRLRILETAAAAAAAGWSVYAFFSIRSR